MKRNLFTYLFVTLGLLLFITACSESDSSSIVRESSTSSLENISSSATSLITENTSDKSSNSSNIIVDNKTTFEGVIRVMDSNEIRKMLGYNLIDYHTEIAVLIFDQPIMITTTTGEPGEITDCSHLLNLYSGEQNGGTSPAEIAEYWRPYDGERHIIHIDWMHWPQCAPFIEHNPCVYSPKILT